MKGNNNSKIDSIKNKNILKIILSNLKMFQVLRLIKYNKNLQAGLNINQKVFESYSDFPKLDIDKKVDITKEEPTEEKTKEIIPRIGVIVIDKKEPEVELEEMKKPKVDKITKVEPIEEKPKEIIPRIGVIVVDKEKPEEEIEKMKKDKITKDEEKPKEVIPRISVIVVDKKEPEEEIE